MAARAKATKRAQRTVKQIERAVIRSGVDVADAYRVFRKTVVEVVRSGVNPIVAGEQIQLATDALAHSLQITYTEAARLADNIGYESFAESAKLFPDAAQSVIPMPQLSTEQQVIAATRRRNLISGLTAQQQSSVNFAVTQFMDPDVNVSLVDTLKSIRATTGASASQSVTQLRTEINVTAARSQVLAEQTQMEAMSVDQRKLKNERFDAVRTSGKRAFSDKMLFPKDPDGPARQVVNCGCTSFIDWQTMERVWVSSFQGGHDSMNSERVEL